MSNPNILLNTQGNEYLIAQLFTYDTLNEPIQPFTPSGGGGTIGDAKWGSIKGTLSNQKDLWEKLQAMQKEIDELDPQDLSEFVKRPELAAYAKITDLDAYAKLEILTEYAKKTDLDVYAKLQDVYNKTQVDELLDTKVDASLVYVKTEVDTLLDDKVSLSELNTLAAKLDIEKQAREQADTELKNKFNNYMDIETTANYVTGEIDNLANTVSQLYVGKSEIYDNYLIDYYQKGETYSKDQVDELIQDIDAGQLRADLDQEIQDRQTADEALDTRIEALEAKTEAIFHYKGTVATIAELPQNAEIGDVYNVEETGSNYAWTGTEWDKLSETIDLTPYMTKDDFNSKVWNKQGGYFETKASTSKGTAIIWNESDGGGSKYEGKDGLWSYTGVNEGTANKVSDTEGNILSGRANEVMGQIYVYDSTNTISEKGNKGSWIDMTLDGFYYKKGTNSNVTTDNELAVIGDVKTVQNGLTELQETVDDTLSHQDGNIQAMVLRIEELAARIEDLKSLDPEVVVFYEGGDTEYNNPIKDFQLSGLITSPAIITSNSVTLKEATQTATYLDFYADQDITIKQSTFEGSVPKATSNAIMRLRANGYITLRDINMTIEKAYNAVECGLTEAVAKSIIIDNVDFNGPLSNNAINVFGMAEGGVVTVSNCHFKKVSNMIRLSNRLNTHWTLNIINCTCDEWETGSDYTGAILLQDYTNKSAEEVEAQNQFNKLTINIQNLTKPDGTKLQPCDLSTICGTKDNNQILYVYDAYHGVRPYDVDVYPTINIQ